MRLFFLLALIIFSFQGCGYTWQNKSNPWEHEGVHTVYISIMKNNSLRAGAEVPFTSAFVKAFSRGNKLKVVNNDKLADTIVEANIESISSTINSSTTVPSITHDTKAEKLGDMLIATDYIARATVSVKIINVAKDTTVVSQSFERSKIYPGNNRFGMEGTTSVLINDSQLQITLADIAKNIALDAYDTMLETF